MESFEEPRKCVACSSPMKFVPAGISKTKVDPKTGNPKHYEAFWSCPNRCQAPKNKSETFDNLGEINDKLDRLINGMTMIHSQLENLIEKK